MSLFKLSGQHGSNLVKKVKKKDGGDVSNSLQYTFRSGLFATSDLSRESLTYFFL